MRMWRSCRRWTPHWRTSPRTRPATRWCLSSAGARFMRRQWRRRNLSAIHLTLVEDVSESKDIVACDTFFPELTDGFQALARWLPPARQQGDRGASLLFPELHARGRGRGGDQVVHRFAATHGGGEARRVSVPPTHQRGHGGGYIFGGTGLGPGRFPSLGGRCGSTSGIRFPLLTTKRVFLEGSGRGASLVRRRLHQRQGAIRQRNRYLGRQTARESTWTALVSINGRRWTWGPSTVSSGGTLAPTTRTMHDNYDGQGVDQLGELVDKIKSNPTDRRLVPYRLEPASAARHGPASLPYVLPVFTWTRPRRSSRAKCISARATLGLGVPFNIASYSLLTMMVAKVCGLKPGGLRARPRRRPRICPTTSSRSRSS